MSALADIAKSDGVIAAVRTTCDQWNDAGGCERAGDGPWCDLLRPWIGACTAVGRGATIMLDDGPAIRVRMSGTDVVAVAFVPGHRVVKSLSRMMRRALRVKRAPVSPSPTHTALTATAATAPLYDVDPLVKVDAPTSTTIPVMATARLVDVTGPVPPGVVLW